MLSLSLTLMVSTECSGQLPCQFLELCETPLRFLPSYILEGSIKYFSKCFLLIFLFFTRDFHERKKSWNDLYSFSDCVIFLFWVPRPDLQHLWELFDILNVCLFWTVRSTYKMCCSQFILSICIVYCVTKTAQNKLYCENCFNMLICILNLNNITIHCIV